MSNAEVILYTFGIPAVGMSVMAIAAVALTKRKSMPSVRDSEGKSPATEAAES